MQRNGKVIMPSLLNWVLHKSVRSNFIRLRIALFCHRKILSEIVLITAQNIVPCMTEWKRPECVMLSVSESTVSRRQYSKQLILLSSAHNESVWSIFRPKNFKFSPGGLVQLGSWRSKRFLFIIFLYALQNCC